MAASIVFTGLAATAGEADGLAVALLAQPAIARTTTKAAASSILDLIRTSPSRVWMARGRQNDDHGHQLTTVQVT
jgi:hypothetical protein